MEERNVVTIFLFHRGKILLLRRSEKVGTYKGKWAGVSGYIEQGEKPYQTALKELSEEVGLASEDIELIKEGKALQVLDIERNISWNVHPYLFHVKNPPKIRIDWEHTEMRWIDPEEIRAYHTVPMLPETLEKVYDQQMYSRIEELRTNVKSGASQLAREALNVLRDAVKRDESETCENFLTFFRQIGKELIEIKPGMAPIANLVSRALHQVSEKAHEEKELRPLKTYATFKIDELHRSSELAAKKAAEYAALLLTNSEKVMSCSYSSTVYETLKIAKYQGKSIKVTVAESLSSDGKLRYGEILAEQLRSNEIFSEIIHDETIESYTPKVNKVLVGADSILSDGFLINGTPTRRLALATKKYAVPFYTVCETNKFNVFGEARIEKGFDLIEPELLTRVITEKGVFTPEEIVAQIKKMKNQITFR